MKKPLLSILNFYIYSSIHISITATLFVAETYFFVCQEIDLFYLGLVFCSTLFIYSVHRIIGISKISKGLIEGRYSIILKYKSHLKVYAAVSIIGLLYFLSQTSLTNLYFLIPLGVMSMMYTLPLLSNQRRLRDYHYIKIFLIAIVWAGIAIGPMLTNGHSILLVILLILFLEKIIYIIAITLPFDIRDIDIDKSLITKTIPQSIGKKKTYLWIYALLILGFASYAVSSFMDNQASVIPYILMAYLLSLIAVYASKGKSSDYLYSGLLDGIIGIRSVVVIFGCLA